MINCRRSAMALLAIAFALPGRVARGLAAVTYANSTVYSPRYT